MTTKVISLVSGGLDSILATCTLKDLGFEVTSLFVDYGQYPVAPELAAVIKCIGRPQIVKVDLTQDTGAKVGSLWGRGIMLVGIAASWAYINGDDFTSIALGNHKGDVGPDCKPGDFDNQLSSVLLLATRGKISLSLPVKDLTVEEIGDQLDRVYGVDLRQTYSCYWSPPCGFRSINDTYLCPGCRRKQIAMKAAGYNKRDWEYPNLIERTYQSKLATKTEY